MKIKSIILLATLYIFLPINNCYADFTTGMVTGMAIGTVVDSNDSEQSFFTDVPEKILSISIYGGVGCAFCSHPSMAEYKCPSGEVKKILWNNNAPDKLLCFKKK
jgi:hypothetical protein